MNMVHRKHLGLGTAILALAAMPLALSLMAQERRAAAPAETARGNLDPHFAACLALSNQNEIAAAKWAQQRSKNPEVKNFAQTLEKDHQQFLTELQKVAGNQMIRDRRVEDLTTALRDDAEGNKTEAGKTAPKVTARDPAAGERPKDAAGRPVANVGPGRDGDLAAKFLQIKREIADECLATAQRELSAKEGKEFDACFIGMQLGAHMYMVDELKVLERHASGEFQGTLRKGRETAQRHVDQAKKIMKNLEDDNSRKTTAK